MTDRRIRTIIVFAFVAGLFIASVSFGMYIRKWPTWTLVTIFVVYSIAQVSFAPLVYRRIYESRLVDLPAFLRKRYPPLGYQNFSENPDDSYDVILLRTPSQVLSAPDCGEAMGLGYLAGELRKRNVNVLVLDARLMGLDVMQTVELLMMYKTPMLGINLNFQYLAPTTFQLVRALRQRKYSSHITMGGLYASVAYEELMELVTGIDTIVRFEGEKTYLDLVENLDQPEEWSNIQGLVFRDNSGNIIVNPMRPLISDLNEIVNPERDYLPYIKKMGGYAYVVSSRGCNGVCAYCVQQRSVSDPKGSRWRGRDPVEVAEELKHVRDEYGIRAFSFVDDDLFGAKVNGKTHAERVAEALIEKNVDIDFLISVQPRDIEYESCSLLKQAGLNSVILAVDNFSQGVLDRYRKLTTVEQNLQSIKILNDLDIDAYLGIIMFDPWTTLDELTENLSVMRDLPYLRPWQILSKLEVYHGSPITEELEELGLLDIDGFSFRFRYLDNRIQGVYLAIESLMKILHPSLMELDKFRWGNLDYTDPDCWILKHRREELRDLNREYNRDVLDLAIEIVQHQSKSTEPIEPTSLADGRLIHQAEIINETTLRKISSLRDEMQETDEDLEVNTVPLEMN